MDLRSKLAFLKARPLLKCMNKNEALEEHAATWRENGLRVGAATGDRLRYKIESSRPFGGGGASTDSSASIASDAAARYCTRYVVDVQLNGHWTDDRCGAEDTQMDPAPTAIVRK